MLIKMRNILMVYFYNPVFAVASIVLILCALVSKYFYLKHQTLYAGDMQTLFFVFGSWIIFHIGVIIKRQFANHRATLLPGYRTIHILAACSMYLLLGVVLWIWNSGLHSTFPMSEDTLHSVYLLVFVTAFWITYVAYLSMGRMIIYTYVAVLVMANLVLPIIDLLELAPLAKYFIFIMGCIGLALFYVRLKNLNAEDFEYNYLFTLSSQRKMFSQIAAMHPSRDVKSNAMQTIAPYHTHTSFMQKSRHWECAKPAGNNKQMFIGGIMLLSFMYLLYTYVPLFREYAGDVSGNFILLVVSPVILVLITFYSQLAYWGYDILKPVAKHDYFLQREAQICRRLCLYWGLFSILIISLNGLQSNLFVTAYFWSFMALTLSVSYLSLVVLGCLSCVTSDVKLLVSGAVFILILLVVFYCMQSLTTNHLIGLTIISVVSSIILRKKAHRLWCDKEFV